MTSLLRNRRQEHLAVLLAKGNKTIEEALVECGYKPKSQVYKKPHVQQRIRELMQGAASRAQISRANILERIYDDWDLARKLGQVSAALKAAEMIGKEIHKMFVDRREVGGPGDFDNKTEAELREFIAKELKELGMDDTISPPSSESIN